MTKRQKGMKGRGTCWLAESTRERRKMKKFDCGCKWYPVDDGFEAMGQKQQQQQQQRSSSTMRVELCVIVTDTLE